MMEVIRQYEERLQKMRGVLEESESKSKLAIQELKTKQQDGNTISSLLSVVINERFQHLFLQARLTWNI